MWQQRGPIGKQGGEAEAAAATLGLRPRSLLARATHLPLARRGLGSLSARLARDPASTSAARVKRAATGP